MGFEPRMRGRRFGRPAMKKTSTKARPEASEPTIFYKESIAVNPVEICSATLNSLEHLGKQRFALPPFAEHFQRWTKDVRALLSEFEISLPTVLDQQSKERIESTLGSLQAALDSVASIENRTSSEVADAQRELSACENELSRLEHDYKNATSQLRRRSEQSFEKIRSDINTLDKQRSQLLHAKPTFFQRMFRKPDTKLEEKTAALQTRKNNLSGSREQLKQDLEKHRIDYEKRRKDLIQGIATLRERLAETKGRTSDDALELRGKTCHELADIVQGAVDRFLKQTASQNVEESGQTNV